MKKIITLLLAASLLLVACSNKIDGKAIYQEMQDNMAKVDSVTMVMDIKIETPSDEDDSFTLPINMKMKIEDINSNKPKIYNETTINIFNNSTTLKQWYLDDKIYIEQDGLKYVMDDIGSDESSFNSFYKFDADEEIKAQLNEENKYLLEIKVTKDKINNLINEVMNMENIIDDNFKFNIKEDVVVKMTANENKYLENSHIDIIVNIEELGDLIIGLDINYSDLNDTKIDDIDKDSFIKNDNEIMYGSYDLTNEHINSLETLGYLNLNDGLYTNGEFYIDLVNKQFYTYDMTLIYDWQYDQGLILDENLEVSCAYNFLKDEIEGECDGMNLKELKDTYEELAKGILGE